MIGIFDSGYGGLTIMKEIVKALPAYDYMYLGDNARTPYGNHDKETVTRFTDEGVRFLFEHGAQLVIIACFTASALALRELQEKHLRSASSPYKERKILGVIRPVAEEAVQLSKSGVIGVVGTRATVSSQAMVTELKAQEGALQAKKNLRIVQQACPLLVPFIEEHAHEKPEAKMVLRKYLQPLKNHHIDVLVLGCTHYPLMIKDFKRMMGPRVTMVNPGEVVAKSLQKYLQQHPEIEKKLSKKGGREFLTTENGERFSTFVKTFAGMKDIPAAQVSLGERR